MRAELVLVLALVLTGCSRDEGSKASRGILISIHLSAPNAATNVFTFDGENFESEAIVSDPDFTEFDAAQETWTLKPKAARRLSDAIWNRHSLPPRSAYGAAGNELLPSPTGFVLKAEGEPIFSGVFYQVESSTIYKKPMFIANPNFLSTNETKNVAILRTHWFESPNSEKGKSNTPGDPRIAKAAAKLIKARGI